MTKIPDNSKKRDVMKGLKSKSNNDLESLYNEYNTEISKTRGMAKARRLEGDYSMRNYNIAVKNRARVLTILNQRRHERMIISGGL